MSAAAPPVEQHASNMVNEDSDDENLRLAIEMSQRQLSPTPANNIPTSSAPTVTSTSAQSNPSSDTPTTSTMKTQNSDAVSSTATCSSTQLTEVIKACWGSLPLQPPTLEVLKRWQQGFQFAQHEQTALLQGQGGPCGVLGPTQAHILKNLLEANNQTGQDWRRVNNADEVLVAALADMLTLAATSDGPKRNIKLVFGKMDSTTIEDFHTSLVVTEHVSHDDAARSLLENFDRLTSQFGVLHLMYSCVATRGVVLIEQDLGMDIEPLVSLPFGHANMSLVNLFLTGIATPHVHDGIKDVGMPLKGVLQQPDVGYLTVMESLRYTTVGKFLKNPKHPIWLIGSETHITVLFSLDRRLVVTEGPITKAKRVFGEFDESGGGFVAADKLPQILQRLGINKTETEINAHARRMGAYDMGVVLLSSFLDELYPGQSDNDVPAEFVVFHYNGMSSPGEVVRYTRGVAKSIAPRDFGSVPIAKVLRTKWTPLQVEWESVPRI